MLIPIIMICSLIIKKKRQHLVTFTHIHECMPYIETTLTDKSDKKKGIKKT